MTATNKYFLQFFFFLKIMTWVETKGQLTNRLAP